MPIIKNIMFTSGVNNNPIDLQCQLNFQPDEAIIRQITHVSGATSNGVYLIWSSLIQDYIGAYHNQTMGCITCPNTRIILKSGVPNSLQFRIDLAGAGAVSGLPGQWAVHIDFIKY